VSIMNYDLTAMKNVDIRTVDPSTLANLHDLQIDFDLPVAEKATAYLEQIKNSYCFNCGDVIVKVSYAETTTSIEDCMEGFYRSLRS